MACILLKFLYYWTIKRFLNIWQLNETRNIKVIIIIIIKCIRQLSEPEKHYWIFDWLNSLIVSKTKYNMTYT